MDINNMTKQQFLELPILEEEVDCDSIVLLPTKKHYDSGYNYFSVAICNENEVIGKTSLYDIFSVFTGKEKERIGIDCLRRSGLMRIFLQRGSFIVEPYFHSVIAKGGGKTYNVVTRRTRRIETNRKRG